MVPKFKGIKDYEKSFSNEDWNEDNNCKDDNKDDNKGMTTANVSNDNEKRLKSLSDNLNREKLNKSIIKEALSDKRLNKRIVFDSDNEDNSEQSVANIANAVAIKKRKPNKKPLFESDSSDSERDIDDQTFGFTARKEVLNLSGEKAEKLIELQSRFAHDNRFRIDHRFVDEFGTNNNDNEVINETEKNLHLLQEVLGKSRFDANLRNNNSLANNNTTIKESKLFVTRFDPSNQNSAIYEIKSNKPVNKTKKVQQTEEIAVETKTKEPEVSKEVYYEISSTLKESLTTKDEPFSLTKLFGSQNDNKDSDNNNNSDDNDTEIFNSQTTTHAKLNKNLLSLTKNPFKYDSSSSDEDDDDNDDDNQDLSQNQISDNSAPHFNMNYQKFFFEDNDTRFNDDLFDSEELIEKAKANGKERQQLMIKAMRIRKRSAKKNIKAIKRDREKQLRGQSNFVKNNYKRHI